MSARETTKKKAKIERCKAKDDVIYVGISSEREDEKNAIRNARRERLKVLEMKGRRRRQKDERQGCFRKWETDAARSCIFKKRNWKKVSPFMRFACDK